MPLYEYECTSCGFQFERRQGFSDDPIQTCPECDGQVRRVFHSVRVIFKGSGFYVTDNRSSSRASSGPDRKEKTSEDQTSSNGKDDSGAPSKSTKTKDEKAHSKTQESA